LCLISQVWLNNRLGIKYAVYEVPTMIKFNELMLLVLVVYSILSLTQASVDLDANVL